MVAGHSCNPRLAHPIRSFGCMLNPRGPASRRRHDTRYRQSHEVVRSDLPNHGSHRRLSRSRDRARHTALPRARRQRCKNPAGRPTLDGNLRNFRRNHELATQYCQRIRLARHRRLVHGLDKLSVGRAIIYLPGIRPASARDLGAVDWIGKWIGADYCSRSLVHLEATQEDR